MRRKDTLLAPAILAAFIGIAAVRAEGVHTIGIGLQLWMPCTLGGSWRITRSAPSRIQRLANSIDTPSFGAASHSGSPGQGILTAPVGARIVAASIVTSCGSRRSIAPLGSTKQLPSVMRVSLARSTRHQARSGREATTRFMRARRLRSSSGSRRSRGQVRFHAASSARSIASIWHPPGKVRVDNCTIFVRVCAVKFQQRPGNGDAWAFQTFSTRRLPCLPGTTGTTPWGSMYGHWLRGDERGWRARHHESTERSSSSKKPEQDANNSRS